MEPVLVNTVICPACGAELAAAMQECDRCGSQTSGSNGAGKTDGSAVSSQQKVIDKPWVVLGLLFGVAAGFALPFLWKSNAFSRFWKAVLTVIVAFYTILILWLIYLCCVHIWDTVSQLWR